MESNVRTRRRFSSPTRTLAFLVHAVWQAVALKQHHLHSCKHQHGGLQPLKLHKCRSKMPWAQCWQHRKLHHSQFWQKVPRAPVQQELTQHTKVARMCDVISANKLAFKGFGSSFSEKRHGIQSSHTKAFFLPYKDVGLSGACRVALKQHHLHSCKHQHDGLQPLKLHKCR